MDLKVVLVALVCLCPLIREISGVCVIEVPVDVSFQPIFTDKRGLIIPVRQYDLRVEVPYKSSISVRCGSRFKTPVFDSSEVNVYCGSNRNGNYEIRIAGEYFDNSIYMECKASNVVKNCQIHLPLDASLRPKLNHTGGNSPALQMLNKLQVMELPTYEEIFASCVTGFKRPLVAARETTILCGESNVIHISGVVTNSSEILLECLPNISQNCQIEIPETNAIKPKFYQIIGSHNVPMSNENTFVNIPNEEQVVTSCDTKFTSPYDMESQLNITCESGHLTISGSKINKLEASVKLECESARWQLYETSTAFSWCPPEMASYLIARSYHSKEMFSAGVCYNFNGMTLVSLRYKPDSSSHKLELQTLPALTSYTKVVEIPNLSSKFAGENVKPSDYENLQIQKWIQFANYQKYSIIQHDKIQSDTFEEFSGLLSVDWWPNLRLGNWRIYEEALAQHMTRHNMEYDILAGISDTVSVPIYKEVCHENRTMVKVVDKHNGTLPMYVWHYLQVTKNQNESVVIIGVNSPFFELYKESDVIFCKDICHEVDWLQKVHSTFRVASMGVIFCCSVNDVMQSERLDGGSLLEIPSAYIPAHKKLPLWATP